MPLRVAYVGSDLFWPCLARLLERPDVTVTTIIAADPPQALEIQRLAAQYRVPQTSLPLTPGRVAALAHSHDLVVVASYNSLIPVPVPAQAPGAIFLNIHPALLPQGRGPNPIPWILLGAPQAAGVTIHVMTAAFDAGPIVASAPIAIADAPDFYAYAYLSAQVASALLDGVVQRLVAGDPLPRTEQRETDAVFWPAARRPSVMLRDTSSGEIQRLLRAFGPKGVRVVANDGASFTIHALIDAGAGHAVRPGTLTRCAVYLELHCADRVCLVRPGFYQPPQPVRPSWRQAARRMVSALTQ